MSLIASSGKGFKAESIILEKLVNPFLTDDKPIKEFKFDLGESNFMGDAKSMDIWSLGGDVAETVFSRL